MKINHIYNENCLTGLKKLPAECIDCCITSPPYWGLRDYGTGIWKGGNQDCSHIIGARANGTDLESTLQKTSKGSRPNLEKQCKKCGAIRIDKQVGMEPTPEEYTATLTEIFNEVRRVLKPHGTLWLNLGDSYARNGGTAGGGNRELLHMEGKQKRITKITSPCLKPKDLAGIPWRIAFALQGFAVVPFQSFSQWAALLSQARHNKDWELVQAVENMLAGMDIVQALSNQGWYLRQDIIWAKGISAPDGNQGSTMPESVTDRCTKAHEYIFLLAKNPKYYYDAEAIKLAAINPEDDERRKHNVNGTHKSLPTQKQNGLRPRIGNTHRRYTQNCDGENGIGHSIPWEGPTANKRSVWHVNTKGFKEAHFATFPEALIADMVKAGCPLNVCRSCGTPKIHITEKKYKVHKNWFGSKQNARNSRGKQGTTYKEPIATKDKGYIPTCECNSEFEPGIILDPFMGAGTTAVVARKLGRRYIGYELNADYIAMAHKRLAAELGIFA